MVAKPSPPPLKNTDEEIIALFEKWLTAFEKTQSATGDEEADATLARHVIVVLRQFAGQLELPMRHYALASHLSPFLPMREHLRFLS